MDITDKNKTKWLGRYLAKLQNIQRLNDRLSELDQRIVSAGTVNYTGMPRGGNPVTVEDLLCDKEILENRIAQSQDIANRYKREIIQAIDTLDNITYVEIIEARYITGKSIEDIAEDLGYSLRHVQRLYAMAVDDIEIR